MPTYISILRGINVSGQKLIKMKSLQEMYEKSGFKDVRTYIQSGNIVFNTDPTDSEKLENLISKEILKYFGFEVPVLVLQTKELKNISEHNPFIGERKENISFLHVTFLSAMPDDKHVEDLLTLKYLPDEYYIDDRAIYLFCPHGYGRTKLNNTFFEKKLKVKATTRNWKTVIELVRISEKQ